MQTKKYDSVRTYLPPLYSRLVRAKAEYTGQSESSIVADAVKKEFDNMPIKEKEHILSFTEK